MNRIKEFVVRIRQSDIGNRLISGAFWSMTGTAVSQGLMLFTSIIIARILGKTEYGELGIIRSTVSMFTVFAGFGLGLTTTKYVAGLKKTDKERTGKIIGLSTLFAGITGIIIAAALLLFSAVIATKTINAPHLTGEIRLSALIMFFGAVNGAQSGILAGYEAFKTVAINNLISGLLSIPVQVGLTLLIGLKGAVLGLGINLSILWVLQTWAVRRESKKAGVSIIYRKSFSEWPVLYRFSLPSLLSGLLVSPVLWVCNTMLVNRPHGYEEMAVYDAANQWRSAILFIPMNLSQIALPLLAGSAENQQRFIRILKLNLLLVFIISAVVAIIISLGSGLIMSFYGPGFAKGSTVLILLSFSTVMFAVSDILGKAVAGKGMMWFGFGVNAVWACIITGCSYIFLENGLAANGLALANITAYFSLIIILAMFIRKSQNLNLKPVK